MTNRAHTILAGWSSLLLEVAEARMRRARFAFSIHMYPVHTSGPRGHVSLSKTSQSLTENGGGQDRTKWLDINDHFKKLPLASWWALLGGGIGHLLKGGKEQHQGFWNQLWGVAIDRN